MFDYSKLSGRIKEKHKTQRTIAELAGMSENSFSNKMTGKVSFTAQEIYIISEALDIPKSEIGTYFFTH